MLINYINRLNITMVYKNLTECFISRDKIKQEYDNCKLFDAPDNNLIIDFPETNKDCKFQAIYDKKRLKVNLFIRKEIVFGNIDNKMINQLASLSMFLHQNIDEYEKINKLYGFNFDGTGQIKNKSAVKVFKEAFLGENEKKIEEKANGEIPLFSPRFTIDYNKYKLNISIQPHPKESHIFKSHINVHFDKPFLKNIDLVQELSQYYSQSLFTLNKILNLPTKNRG